MPAKRLGGGNNEVRLEELNELRAWALEAGFSDAGVVSLPHAAEARDAARFNDWIAAGKAGTMGYLERTAEDGQLLRARVQTPFPWARSVIVCFASYHADQPRSTDPVSTDPVSTASVSTDAAPAGAGWIARYAWSSRKDPQLDKRPSDYHKVLLKRLKALEARIRKALPAAGREEFTTRAFVDTGPVVERSLAVAAGLGWTGKNTCLIHPKLGSYGFLAVLLTSLEVSVDSGDGGPVLSHPGRKTGVPTEGSWSVGSVLSHPSRKTGVPTEGSLSVGWKDNDAARVGHPALIELGKDPPTAQVSLTAQVPDRCGSCTRCLEACPTGALIAPYQMDASRCIAYLTIEHKGPIAEDLMAGMGRQVFGCDICQDVCPWNRKAPFGTDPELEARAELVNPALEWLATMNEEEFERSFNGSPVRRAGYLGLLRNVAIALGNSGLRSGICWLEDCKDSADEGLRVAARWALQRLRATGQAGT
jgi:epoxyqueuosine reductase QueG